MRFTIENRRPEIESPADIRPEWRGRTAFMRHPLPADSFGNERFYTADEQEFLERFGVRFSIRIPKTTSLESGIGAWIPQAYTREG